MANAEKYSNCGMFNKIERPKSFEYKIDKTKKWKFKQILEPKNMKIFLQLIAQVQLQVMNYIMRN